MKFSLLSAVSALCLIATAAFAQTAAPPAAPPPATQSPATATSSSALTPDKDIPADIAGRVVSEQTVTAKGFAAAAAIGDLYEVEAGKIAQQRAQAPEVKAFAAKMIEAHTGTTRKLKDLLAKNTIVVPVPTQIDDRRQKMLDDLRAAKPEEFDRRYLAQQEDAHQEAEILMSGYAQTGYNADMKSFAADNFSVAKDDLGTIRKLETGAKTASR